MSSLAIATTVENPGRRPVRKAKPTGGAVQRSVHDRRFRSKRNGQKPKRMAEGVVTMKSAFPELSSPTCYGVGIAVTSVRRLGTEGELVQARLARHHRKPGERPTLAILESTEAAAVARSAAGLGHVDRVRIARAMARGAITHHEIAKAVGLKTGPLYHHLRALERAGMVTIRGRNEYALTPCGKLVLLAVTAIVGEAEKARLVIHSFKMSHKSPPKASSRARRAVAAPRMRMYKP